jgi:hypothetical protein
MHIKEQQLYGILTHSSNREAIKSLKPGTANPVPVPSAPKGCAISIRNEAERGKV